MPCDIAPVTCARSTTLHISGAMSNGDLTPFPSALVLDTSFLRTVGGTGSAAYQTFSEYVETEGIELFLGERIIEELTEQRGYISIDWIDKARTTDWVTIVDPVQPGVRVHDGPRAGVIMDRVHQRLATVEQIAPDELRKTDTELAAVAVMLLGSTPHDSVGILMDDKNAEQAIAGIITNTYYEGRVRMLNIWDAIAFMES
jgi:hypothetical protein